MIDLRAYDPKSLGDVDEVWKLANAGTVSSRCLYGWLRGEYQTLPTVTAAPVRLPEHCSECNHHNPYVGKEHITACGKYVCRQCKPRWLREQSLVQLKAEAAAREAGRSPWEVTK